VYLPKAVREMDAVQERLHLLGTSFDMILFQLLDVYNAAQLFLDGDQSCLELWNPRDATQMNYQCGHDCGGKAINFKL
jgi:hypothetical protein